MSTENSSDTQRTILRQPAEETVDIYPGLVVSDDRVGGSITASRSRLPLREITSTVIGDNWEAVIEGWPYLEEEYHWTKQKTSDFLYNLLESRGEFGRLVLLMAEVERLGNADSRVRWYNQPELRQVMREQLQRCLDTLRESRGAAP